MNEDVFEQQRIIVAGEEVQNTLNTLGWKDYIEPLLDKMIGDVLGRKENGRWHNGALDTPLKEEVKLREMQMYKAALVNFHDAVYTMVDDVEIARSNLAELKKEEVSPYESA